MSDEQQPPDALVPRAVDGEVVDPAVERKRKARARKAAAIELKLKVFALRRGGGSFQEIADQVGISKTRVHQIVTEALDELSLQLSHTVEHYRALELARLDKLILRLEEQTKRSPFAVIAYLKVMERRAKLLGLDRPLKFAIENGGAPERELTDDALDKEIDKLQREIASSEQRKLRIVKRA